MSLVVQLRAGSGRWTTYSLRSRIKAFYVYGHEFYSVAIKTGSPLVKYYLIGHAFELFLKTYLLYSGKSASTLKSRPLGHNLRMLFEECVTRGLADHFQVSVELKSDVTAFTDVYATKKLEYFSLFDLIDPPSLPDMSRLCRFVALLDRKLLVIVTPRTQEHSR